MKQDNSALLPVSFHGDTLYLIDHHGEPYTPMKPIVEGMGLAWGAQQQKLQSNKDRWGISIIDTVAQDGRQRETLCMPVRKLPAFFASIHPNKVRAGIRHHVIQYQIECDDVLWKHWSGQHRPKLASQLVDPRLALTDTRWLLTFHADGKPSMTPIRPGAFVLGPEKWAGVIRTSDFPRRLLPDLLAAVSERIRAGS